MPRYEMKMRATEDRMRALGLLTPMSVLTLDEWEIPRDRVVINRYQQHPLILYNKILNTKIKS